MSEAETTEAVVRALFTHWLTDEDLDDYVAADAVFVSAMAPGRTYHGPEGARHYRRDAEEAGLDITPTVHDIYIDDGRALVTGSLVVNNGQRVDRLDLIWGCRVEGGKLREGRAFVRRDAAWAWFDPRSAAGR